MPATKRYSDRSLFHEFFVSSRVTFQSAATRAATDDGFMRRSRGLPNLWLSAGVFVVDVLQFEVSIAILHFPQIVIIELQVTVFVVHRFQPNRPESLQIPRSRILRHR